MKEGEKMDKGGRGVPQPYTGRSGESVTQLTEGWTFSIVDKICLIISQTSAMATINQSLSAPQICAYCAFKCYQLFNAKKLIFTSTFSVVSCSAI